MAAREKLGERIRSSSRRAVERAREARRKRVPAEAERRRREALSESTPYVGLVRAPSSPHPPPASIRRFRVATYNVHRWTGLGTRPAPDPARAGFVISELDADVIALQEVLRPFEGEDDPLARLAERLRLHVAFVVTRVHRRGELGNAVLSRWPIRNVSTLALPVSRLERRSALAVGFGGAASPISVVSTHLSLVDRTRQRQVDCLLGHPHLSGGAVILLGDMNAWRRCKGTRALESRFSEHHNLAWPASFPAAAPVLALDRIYAEGARVLELRAHQTAAARRASDHLPVVATLELRRSAAVRAD